MKSLNLTKKAKIILIVALILVLAGVYVYAKYIYTEPFSGSVTITADLGSVTILEHKAEKQADGSYVLDLNTTVSQNDYLLIPGLDVPKDPFIKITDKSNLPAYAFVEVVANFEPSEDSVLFSLTEKWELLEGVTGPNGGKVYYYVDIITGCASQKTFELPVLQTLSGSTTNTIQVSQKMKEIQYMSGSTQQDFYPSGTLQLDFHAYMGQVIDGKTPKEIFEIIF